MKKNVILLAAVVGLGLVSSARAAFPALGNDTAPDVVITYDGSSFSVAYNQNNGPFDGIEDTYVGVLNTSANKTLPSISISGNFIFGFDGDGEAAFGGGNNGPTGYEGPGTSFNVSTVNQGVVNFTGGIPAGGSAWFTLEETITGANGSGITVTAPDASSSMLMLSGALLGLGALRRRLS